MARMTAENPLGVPEPGGRLDAGQLAEHFVGVGETASPPVAGGPGGGEVGQSQDRSAAFSDLPPGGKKIISFLEALYKEPRVKSRAHHRGEQHW